MRTLTRKRSTIPAGNHSFKAGFEFQRVNITFFQPAYPRRRFSYSGTYTEVPNTGGGNTGRAQLLLTPVSSSVAGGFDLVGGANQVQASNIANPAPSVTRNYFAGYFQYDWKVSHTLTLNLGLRYDFFGHGFAPDGRMANFLMGPPGQAEYLMTTEQCKKNLSPSFLALTAQDGISIGCADPVLTSDKANFAPRVGIAYQITPKFVVRSGFGVFYGTTINGDDLVNGISYPFSYTVTFNFPDPAHPITSPNGLLANVENGLLGAPLADPNGRQCKGTRVHRHRIPVPHSLQHGI